MEQTKPKPFLSLLVLFIVPLILGALLAPHVNNFLAWLSQYIDLGRHFTDPKFKRVVSRCVMVFALILLYPAFKMAGMNHLDKLGWTKHVKRTKLILIGWLIGCCSMGLIYLSCWWSGALYFDLKETELTSMFLGWVALFIGSLFIGMFEEIFFRGYLYGLFRNRFSFGISTICSSILFSMVHFIRPVTPEGLDTSRWYAGFMLLPHIFDGNEYRYLWPTMVTLFLMGVLLCMIRERQRNIYTIVGLHAGWVWVMGMFHDFLYRNGMTYGWLFGSSKTISMTWAGAILLTLTIIVMCVLQQKQSNVRNSKSGIPA